MNGPSNGLSDAKLAGSVDKGKGRGKEVLKEIAPEAVEDGFVIDVDGDDGGLYDD